MAGNTQPAAPADVPLTTAAWNKMQDQIENVTPKNYIVGFEGTYRAIAGGSQKVSKPFQVAVRLPAKLFEDKDFSPLKLFHDSIAPRVMLKKFPDFLGIRTVTVAGASVEGSSERVQDIRIMDYDALREVTRMLQLRIDCSLYRDAHELRGAIDLAKTDPQGYQLQEEKRRRTKGNQFAQESLLPDDLLVE